MKKIYRKPEVRFERLADIEGFPDYQIGDNGTVLSCKYGKVRVLRPVDNGSGYYQVGLCKDGKKFKKLVHRLVAEAFLHNPENKPCIDHIDGNPKNNSVSNLRWCNQKENCNNPISLIRSSEARIGKNYRSKKPVICFNKKGTIKVYPSLYDTEKDGFHEGHVSDCCKGKRKSHKGHQFRYATEEDVN